MAKIAPVRKAAPRVRGTIAQQVGVRDYPSAQPRQLSQEELSERQQKQVQRSQEEFVKAETKKVDNLISEYQNQLTNIAKKQQIAAERGDRSEWNSLDNDRAFYTKQIRNLALNKSNIRQGASFRDVTAQAVAKSSQEIKQIETAKQAGYRSVYEYRAGIKGIQLKPEIGLYYDPKTQRYYDTQTGKLKMSENQQDIVGGKLKEGLRDAKIQVSKPSAERALALEKEATRLPLPEPQVYFGPVRPGTSEKVFRETGKERRVKSGPVPFGTSEEVFRETGQTKITSESQVFGFDVDRTGQTYGFKTGLYTAPTYGDSAQGTLSYFAPTISEKTKIEEANYFGTLGGITELGKKGLSSYEQNVVVPISKSGAFKWYEQNVVIPTSEYFVQPGTSLLKKGIEKYEEKVVIPFRKFMPTLGETPIGQIAGQITEAKRVIESKAPEETIRIGLPGQIREVKAGDYQGTGLFDFGKKVYLGEVETAFTSIGTKAGFEKPEYFGKGAKIVSEFGLYMVPGYFGLEYGAGLFESFTGGKFGGPSSTWEYVKSKPMETAIIGVLGISSIVKPFTTAAKEARALKKYGSYIRAKRKSSVLEAEYFTKIKKVSSGKGSTARVRVTDEASYLKFTPKSSGQINIIQQQPTGRWFGEVDELLKIGKGKTTLVKGKASIIDDVYRETFQYPKGIKKIIEVPTGKQGTVKIFKKNKLVSELKLGAKESRKINFKTLKDIRKKQFKVGKPGTTETIKTRGIDPFDITPRKTKDLSTSLIKKEKKGVLEFGRDKNIFQSVERIDDITDITRVGTKKDILSLKQPGKSFLRRKETSMEILYGDTSKNILKDVSGFSRVGGKEKLVKKISPDINRVIQQSKATRLTTTYDDLYAIKQKKSVDIFSKSIKTKPKDVTKVADDILSGNQKLITKTKPKDVTKVADDILSGNQKLITKTKPVQKEVFYIEKPTQYLEKQVTKIPYKSLPQSSFIKTKLSKPFSLSRKITNVYAISAFKPETKSTTTQTVIQQSIQQPTTESVSNQLYSQQQSSRQSSSFAASTSLLSDKSSSDKIKLYTPSGIATIKPKEKPPIVIFPLPSFGKKVQIYKDESGYIPQAKSGNKWITLSRKPMTRTDALSRAARAVDNTTSSQFRIKKAKGETMSGFDNYFGATQQKYRQFKIKKGKKFQLKDKFIEKTGSRIDTAGEKAGLKLAQYAKQQGWLQPTTKRNKKKRVNNKKKQVNRRSDWLV